MIYRAAGLTRRDGTAGQVIGLSDKNRQDEGSTQLILKLVLLFSPALCPGYVEATLAPNRLLSRP
jgi:hypothetical protein